MTTRPNLETYVPERHPGASPGVISVSGIPGYTRHFVGRDSDGRTCVLVGSQDSGIRAPVRLSGLEVQYSLSCALSTSGAEIERRVLSVITFTGENRDTERYFLFVLSTLLELVGDSPSLVDIGEAVTRVAGLFQKLTAPASESVAGVIGELMLVAEAIDPDAAIASWRVDPTERYDFVSGDLRLEVKSSLSRRRTHSFSFEQCDIPRGCYGLVASIFIEKSAGGLSLEDLVARIHLRLLNSPISALILQQTLAATLGQDLPAALSFCFDDSLARSSLAFFDLATVPAIRPPLDPRLSQVRFVSDLGQVAALELKNIAREVPNFSSFAPLKLA